MLVSGKTDEEYLQLLNVCLCADFMNKSDKVLDNRVNNCITIYCNKKGKVLIPELVEQLKSVGKLSDKMKEELDIDDDWDFNYYIVSLEQIMQLLFMCDREQLLSIVKDMMCCLTK